jgi:ATP-dependent Clp protease ATP-binding subunit ClpA
MTDLSLPVLATSFIGRDEEIQQIVSLLHEPRCQLVTLVGSGGVGKTRLALEIATRVQNTFPDAIPSPIKSVKVAH